MEQRTNCNKTKPEFLSQSFALVEASLVGDVNRESSNITVNVQNEMHSTDNGLRIEFYCRVCGLENNHQNLMPIFDDQANELELKKVIFDHLHLQVKTTSTSEENILTICQEHDTTDSTNLHVDELDIDKKFNNKPEDGENVKVEQNRWSLLCHVCGKQFKHATNLQAHKRTHLTDSDKKKHHCSLCPKSFKSRFHLSEHLNVHNGVTPYRCDECSKMFHKQAQLRQHLQVHVDDSKKLACLVCGLRFSRRSNLQVHARTHEENRTFNCRLCHQKFPSFSEMLSHRKRHSQDDIKNLLDLNLVKKKETIFTCQVCGKILTNKDSLVLHMEKHNPEELRSKYKCTECEKVLNSYRSLIYHQRSQHSGERPFHCSFCLKGFMTKKLLQAHERKHTGEKPFKCETCWKGFRSRNNLTQHLLKHNGEKKFECTVCDKKFSRRGALTVHNRKHTGEKPFICDLCGRPFRQKNDMLKHQKTHIEPSQRTNTCELCLVGFSSKKELTKHKEITHSGDVNLVPLIVTNNMFETHVITEDGQKIVFASVETLEGDNLAVSTMSNI